jgi:hypothetical protein
MRRTSRPNSDRCGRFALFRLFAGFANNWITRRRLGMEALEAFRFLFSLGYFSSLCTTLSAQGHHREMNISFERDFLNKKEMKK